MTVPRSGAEAAETNVVATVQPKLQLPAVADADFAQVASEDTSPIGSALLALRRSRAYRCGSPRPFVDAFGEQTVKELPRNDELYPTSGLEQAELDTLCADTATETSDKRDFPADLGLNQAKLDELCTDAEEHSDSPRQVADDQMQHIKRLRAFGRAAEAAAFAEIRMADVASTPCVLDCRDPTKSDSQVIVQPDGLSQAELDRTSVHDSDAMQGDVSTSANPGCKPGQLAVSVKRLRAYRDAEEASSFSRSVMVGAGDAKRMGEGLSQDELDAMCVTETADAKTNELADETSEDVALRVKRLRAFGKTGDEMSVAQLAMAKAAEKEVAASGPEPTPTDQTPTPIGLSQVALDELCVESENLVKPGGAEQRLLCAKENPEAACFLLRRARAYRGASAAVNLANELLGKVALPDNAVADAKPSVKLPTLLQLPVDIRRGGDVSPSRSCSPCSPCKDGQDRSPFARVATPSRRRYLMGDKSPMDMASPCRSPCHSA